MILNAIKLLNVTIGVNSLYINFIDIKTKQINHKMDVVPVEVFRKWTGFSCKSGNLVENDCLPLSNFFSFKVDHVWQTIHV